MSVSDLSASTQNYLKAIWGLSEWSDAPVTPTLIAERTGLRLSSVSDAVRKLATQGLVDHAPYGAVTLTATGRTYALEMVRRHRLIETFLVSTLGYTWDQVHDEAEHLEHAVSDFMVDRIDELLDFPRRDPHGDPIPSKSGDLEMPDAQQLLTVGPGHRVVVERISDANPELLKYCESQGIMVGTALDIAEGAPFSDSVEARVTGGGPSVTLGHSALQALYVSVVGPSADA